MSDESVVVKGNSEDYNLMRLETIRQTYNIYAEKVNNNPKWTINMSQYCQDVGFLLKIIRELLKRVSDK